MRNPEKYFNTLAQNGFVTYQWFDSSRTLLFGFLGIIMAAVFYFEGFQKDRIDELMLIVFSSPLLILALFFFMNDRFKIKINKEEIFLSNGIRLFFSKASCKSHYKRKDIQVIYSVDKWDYSDLNFTTSNIYLYLLLKTGKAKRISNSLNEENGKYLIQEIKNLQYYGSKPKKKPVGVLLKSLLLISVTIVAGVIMPRMMEVGEYSIENMSAEMKMISGCAAMVFMFFILTTTDAIFKEDELTISSKILLFVLSAIPTISILYVWYLS